MKKRYNYFDDDIDESGEIKKPKSKKSAKSVKIDGKKILAVLRYVISVVGVNILIFAKKVYRFFTKSDKKNNAVKLGFFLVLFTIIVTVVIASVSITASTHKQNSKEAKFGAAAYKVCSEYSEKYGIANYKFMNSEYGVKGCMLTGLCVAREIDFNADGSEELLLGYNDNDTYHLEVWGFHSGDFIQLYNKNVFQRSDRNSDIWISLYTDDNQFYLAEHSGDKAENVKILRLAGKEFKEKDEASYDEESLKYTMRKKDATDNFEKIRFAVLRETTASEIVDSTLDVIDGFSKNKEQSAGESNSDSADGKAQLEPINSAYYSIVENYNKEYGCASLDNMSELPCITGLAVVDLIDFNGDGTNELLLIFRRTVNERSKNDNGEYISVAKEKYFCEIYTFNGEKALNVYQSEGISNLSDSTDTAYYIIKNDANEKKLCINTFNYSQRGRVMSSTSKVLYFDGERFGPESKFGVDSEYGYNSYYVNSKSVYKSKFISEGGYSVPFFDGTKTFDSSKYSITYLKVKRDEVSKIKGIPDKTEEVIKKLNPSYNPQKQ